MIRPIFAWYDMWVGAFWDSRKRRLYIFPVPMLGVVFDFGERHKHQWQLNLAAIWEATWTDSGGLAYTEAGFTCECGASKVRRFERQSAEMVRWKFREGKE